MEFAVSITVVLAMLVGMIQCFQALYVYNYVCDAARVGTRYAMVRGSSCTGASDCGATPAQIQTYIQGITYPGIDPGNLAVTTTWLSVSTSGPTAWTACANKCNAPQNEVQVQVTYAFPLNIPFWRNASVDMASSSQMVISN
jgi:Flp pilus assembly protein TadG